MKNHSKKSLRKIGENNNSDYRKYWSKSRMDFFISDNLRVNSDIF